MKAYLQKVVSDKEAQISDLTKRSEASDSVEELRSISKQIDALKAERDEARAQLTKMDAQPAFEPMKALGTVEQKSAPVEAGPDSLEYRSAFKDYVQRGVMSPVLKRSDDRVVSGDLGVLVPQTVMNEIITGVQKAYGVLYARVRKTNVKGGVKYPTGAFSATFHRVTEEGVGASPSDRQNPFSGGYVEFSYNLGEIRIAQSLVAATVALPVFESELAKCIVEAYLKGMDSEIMTGTAANGQCVGILTEAAASPSRIPAGNTIEFTEAEAMDWTEWQKKLFAKIPVGMRGLRPEFVMSAGTYEGVIKSLADDNDRPVYYETFNPVDGAETATFKGREVVFCEEDVFKTFADISVASGSTDSPYFGMLWVPQEAYAINTNLEFYVKRYFDEERNEYVDKALVINDGKVLDGSMIYLLKKVASS